ncbi:BatD family protein [Thalassotalea litorea]|nr:BatD family protein [Thalassotalea litorea]
MMKIKPVLCIITLLTFTAMAQDDAQDNHQNTTQTIESLVASNQLQITIKRVNDAQTIARQAITFEVEVATNRWFSRGTRIEEFDLENTIILPFEGLAFNSSRMIDGATWTTQSRDITIYPLDEGEYVSSQIRVFISVNTEHSGAVEGYWQLDPIKFSVSQPKQLALVDHYVVTDTFRIKKRSDFNKNNNYQIGDSVTLNVELHAERVPAMMLPELTDVDIKGISVFDEEPVLNDQQSRGEFNSSRQQTRTYIFEQAGDYKIPEQKFFFWDPSQKRLKTRKLRGFTIHIESDPNQQAKPRKNEQITPIPTIPWERVFGVALIISLLIVLFRNRQAIGRFYKQVTRYQRRQYRNAYIKACNDGEYQKACECLFRFLQTGKTRHETLHDYFPSEPQRTALKELVALAYDINEPIPQKKLVTRGSFARRNMLSLLKPEALATGHIRENLALLTINPRQCPDD